MIEEPSEKVVAKAAMYLASGNVRVIYVSGEPGEDENGSPLPYVVAHVTPSDGGEPYWVERHTGGWRCDCPARVPVCAHIYAASLVTPESFEPKGEDEAMTINEIDQLLGGL